MMGSFSKLAKESPVSDTHMEDLLQVKLCAEKSPAQTLHSLIWFWVNHAGESSVTATSTSDIFIFPLWQEAAAAIKALYELVSSRGSSGGVRAKLFAFWTAGSYIEKSAMVKDRVQNALEAMMFRSARIPNSKTRAPDPESRILNPETINLPPATPDPPNSISNSQSSTLIPHPSHLNQHSVLNTEY